MVEKYKLARKKKFEEKRSARKEERKKNPDPVEDKQKLKKRRPRNLIGIFVDDWTPTTALGKKVVDGEIKNLDEIFDKNLNILEPLIVDYFIDDLKEKIIDTKKTSYVRMSGRKYGFRSSVLVGDGNKFVGLGTAKDTDKWNAVRKAARKARLNVVRVKRGCGSWQCTCGTEHSVPKVVEGKCGSIRVQLKSAPRGVGLVVADAIKPIFEFVGIKDVWGKGFGNTATTLNFIKATIDALKKTYN